VLPPSGAVLGIDVGWSQTQRSSGICRLDWDESGISWSLEHFTGAPEVRDAVVRRFADGRALLAAAFDGPICRDFRIIGRLRSAERLLSTKPITSRISQPGSSAGGNGRELNHQTNLLAGLVLQHARVGVATHEHRIHEAAIAEAFPTGFLGVMLPNPEPGLRCKRSDRYFVELAETGLLERLMRHHLPGRSLRQSFAAVTNHDERAALICALTALGVAGNDYVAVGDVADGWIILPPPAFIATWATELLPVGQPVPGLA
jgi:hypothetical protein